MSGDVKPGPNEIQLLQAHIQEHLAALKSVNPKAAKAAEDAFIVLFQQLGGQADQSGQGQNVSPQPQEMNTTA